MKKSTKGLLVLITLINFFIASFTFVSASNQKVTERYLSDYITSVVSGVESIDNPVDEQLYIRRCSDYLLSVIDENHKMQVEEFTPYITERILYKSINDLYDSPSKLVDGIKKCGWRYDERTSSEYFGVYRLGDQSLMLGYEPNQPAISYIAINVASYNNAEDADNQFTVQYRKLTDFYGMAEPQIKRGTTELVRFKKGHSTIELSKTKIKEGLYLVSIQYYPYLSNNVG